MIIIIKLLEIFQYVLISFILSFIISILLNDYIFEKRIMEKINEKKLTLKSIGYIIFYLFILSSAYYFILKYSTKIPFFLSPIVHFFGYIPSLKNENKRGASLGAGFIFFREQNTFAILIDKLFKIIN